MPRRVRRFTPHVAAVLWVLRSDPAGDRMWSVAEVTDASGLNPGSVRHILQRLFADGLAARIRIDDSGIGNTRIWYELTEAGERRAKTILKYLPDPIGALHAWLVEHPDDQ